MKRIYLVTHNFLPESVGRSSRVYELANFLKKTHKVTVIAPPPTYPFTKYPKVNYNSKKEKINDIQTIRLKTYQPSEVYPSFFQRLRYFIDFSINCSFFILKNIRKFDSLLLSTPPTTILLVSIVGRLFRKKIIIDVGDLWHDAPSSSTNYSPRFGFLRKIRRKFEVSCWQNCNVILANSKIVKSTIESLIKNSKSSKVIYFPYRVDLDFFKKTIHEPKQQIVFIGNFGVFYNFDALLHAMKVVHEKFPNLKLEMFGGGDQEKKVKNLVKEIEADDYCKINEPVPRAQIPKILSESILGLIPLVTLNSAKYIMPTKTFEYLACGLPIFAFGSSEELGSLLKESKSGISINTDEPKIIAEDIIKLLLDKEALEKYSINGRDYAEKSSEYSQILEHF